MIGIVRHVSLVCSRSYASQARAGPQTRRHTDTETQRQTDSQAGTQTQTQRDTNICDLNKCPTGNSFTYPWGPETNVKRGLEEGDARILASSGR